MSSIEGSCARTRGWDVDNSIPNRYKSSAAPVDDEIIADSDLEKCDDRSELRVSSNGCTSAPSQKEVGPQEEVVEEPREHGDDDDGPSLKSVDADSSAKSRNVDIAKVRDFSMSSRSSENSKEERDEKEKNDKDLVGSIARSDKKSSRRKHKSSSHHKREQSAKESKKKDVGMKISRHKEKIPEGNESGKRDGKRKYDEMSGKKSYKRDRKVEKSQKQDKKSDDEYSHRQEKKRDYSTSDHVRTSSKIDRRKDHKRPKLDGTSDDEHSQRKEKHRDSSKMHHSKDFNKTDRERETRRTKHDRDQKGRSRSWSPKSHKHYSSLHGKISGRSPSPLQREKQERERAEQDKNDKEGGAFPSHFENKFRRFGLKSSGLGGYSPRRRCSDAAIKTPSPPSRSPERRKARAWDLPPAGMDSSMAAAMSAVQQAAAQQAAALATVSSLSSNVVTTATSTTAPAVSLIPSLFTQVNPGVTAVTLTQATRPLRRLYIANVPATVSDGELMEFLNAAMLSANANHIPGTKPCISCLVNVEKSYAFAEFLTPEDATAALAFDGVTLHGTTLKIRRPKDYVQPANGGVEKVSLAVDMVSSVVVDSPRKVFVGGICRSLSSDKVKEIVTAFGQLKAYHWEVSIENGRREAFAFLEYLDPLVTVKACAGLNGMRLGNRMLTVTQAMPNADAQAGSVDNPFYGIPEHVKPLLETPSRILELRNLIREEELLAMPEAELNEFTEDIRLECLRFGTVKSMHIVRPVDNDMAERVGKNDESTHVGEYTVLSNLKLEENASGAQTATQEVDNKKGDEVLAEDGLQEVGFEVSTTIIPEEKFSKKPGYSESKVAESNDLEIADSRNIIEQLPASNEVRVIDDNKVTDTETQHVELDDTTFHCSYAEQKTNFLGPGVHDELVEGPGNAQNQRQSQTGTVYVEFSREESSFQAAHNLHDRMYGERKVIACYFPLKLYRKRFRKGLEPQTIEEKQALALAVQEHLNAYIKD